MKINTNYQNLIKVFFRNIQKRILLLCLVLVGVLVLAQFVILANIGTKGAEVSRIRQQKQEYRIENSSLQAEIDQARTLTNIQQQVNGLQLQPKTVSVIRPDNGDSSAVVIP